MDCACGCGRPAPIAKLTNRRWGHVAGQPVRFIRGHAGRRTVAEKFWAKVQRSDGCWLWTGAKNAQGYGILYLGRAHGVGAHRISYQLATGTEPGDRYVCHRCDNPGCVRPDHLFLGTVQDNNADRGAKGRTRSGWTVHRKTQTHCVHGHPFDEANTYVTTQGKYTVRKCRACRSDVSHRRRTARQQAH